MEFDDPQVKEGLLMLERRQGPDRGCRPRRPPRPRARPLRREQGQPQAFLHARFGLGDDVLDPYKASIDRWLWPDVYGNQDTSVAKAKKAIADCKKAGARPDGLVELMVFYCERASGFSNDIGLQDEDYFDALVRMFEQALKAIADLPDSQRPALWSRLDAVRRISQSVGFGVGEDMDRLLAECARDV